MPGTARALEGRHPGLNTKTRWGNVLGGAYYLAEQYHTFKRWDYALAAYNAGPGAVKNYDGIPPYAETQDYVRTIMGRKPRGGAMTGGGKASPLSPDSLSAGDATALVSPSFTKKDAALEGLRALADGNYDPTAGLAALKKAAEQAAQMGAQAADIVAPHIKFQIGGVPSPVDSKAVALAKRYLGVNYVWGGTTPKGFDCSGLLQWVWGHLGVNIPRTTYEQWKSGKPVDPAHLRPGDAVFFHMGKGGPGHVGMYIGNGRFIEAPHTGAKVRISDLKGRGMVGARRFG